MFLSEASNGGMDLAVSACHGPGGKRAVRRATPGFARAAPVRPAGHAGVRPGKQHGAVTAAAGELTRGLTEEGSSHD